MLLWVPGRFPGMNELVEALTLRVNGRRPGFKYSGIKEQCDDRVVLCVRSQRFKVRGKHFNYLFVEPNRKRDPDNISAGAVKMLLDGLRKAGALENDGWKQVEGDTRYYHCEDGAEPGVCLVVQDCPVLSKEAMIAKLQAFLQKGCVNT